MYATRVFSPVKGVLHHVDRQEGSSKLVVWDGLSETLESLVSAENNVLKKLLKSFVLHRPS